MCFGTRKVDAVPEVYVESVTASDHFWSFQISAGSQTSKRHELRNL